VIPNREVRQIYIEQVRSWFKEKVQVESASLKGFHAAFESGDVERITEVLDAYLLNTVSFHDAHESFYHGFLLALLSTCSEWSVVSNSETGKGRSDIKVERKDRKIGFIVEVKDVKDPVKMQASCEAAIQQIEDKDYTAALRRYRFKDIWIYDIAFCDKECRVIAKHLL